MMSKFFYAEDEVKGAERAVVTVTLPEIRIDVSEVVGDARKKIVQEVEAIREQVCAQTASAVVAAVREESAELVGYYEERARNYLRSEVNREAWKHLERIVKDEVKVIMKQNKALLGANASAARSIVNEVVAEYMKRSVTP